MIFYNVSGIMLGMGWIAVDLDGTLAHYEGWKDGSIGKPIAPMVKMVKEWLDNGRQVKIFTARASRSDQISKIKKWCVEHIGQELEVTNVKDFKMVALYDDRAKQVEKNTGKIIG